jgi:hypothetical protein
VPNCLVKGLCALEGFWYGRFGEISVGLFVADSQYFLPSVPIAFAYGGGRASVSQCQYEREAVKHCRVVRGEAERRARRVLSAEVDPSDNAARSY